MYVGIVHCCCCWTRRVGLRGIPGATDTTRTTTSRVITVPGSCPSQRRKRLQEGENRWQRIPGRRFQRWSWTYNMYIVPRTSSRKVSTGTRYLLWWWFSHFLRRVAVRRPYSTKSKMFKIKRYSSSCRYNERQLIDVTVVRRVRPRAERSYHAHHHPLTNKQIAIQLFLGRNVPGRYHAYHHPLTNKQIAIQLYY